MVTVGELGENFVARWLESRGWEIIARRWRSRWGEIDLIARLSREDTIAFIEVKTRGALSWDRGGREAVDRRKQKRIHAAASYFLSLNPRWTDSIGRFDVAIVRCREGFSPEREEFSLARPRLTVAGHELELLEYIESAFEGES